MPKHLYVYSDGGARGNPGPAGIGVVVCDQNKNYQKFSKFIGRATNNQAEYQALIFGLEKAKKMRATQITCYLDSELVVKQMRGEYRVKDPDLKPLYAAVQVLASAFQTIAFTHVPRTKNKDADKLVNHAIDRAQR